MSKQKAMNPLRLFLVVAISTFSAETILMTLLSFAPQMPLWLETLVDALFLTLLISPFLYYFLLRPLIQNIAERRMAEESERIKSEELKILVERLNIYTESLRIDVRSAKKILNYISGAYPGTIETGTGYAFNITAFNLPCSTEGGDHFFIKKYDGPNGSGTGGTVISLKDQSGHSVPCLLRSISSDLAHMSLLGGGKYELKEAIKALNMGLIEANMFEEGEYFTSVECHIDHETMVMKYAANGHPPFFLIRDGKVTMLPEKGGAGHNMPIALFHDMNVSVGELKLKADDKVLLYTDGIFEIIVGDGGCYGLNRLKESTEKYATLPVADILQKIVGELAMVCGETIDVEMVMNSSDDDITAIGFEVLRATEQ